MNSLIVIINSLFVQLSHDKKINYPQLGFYNKKNNNLNAFITRLRRNNFEISIYLLKYWLLASKCKILVILI